MSLTVVADTPDAAAATVCRNLLMVLISGQELNIFDPFHLPPLGPERFVCASLIRLHRVGTGPVGLQDLFGP